MLCSLLRVLCSLLRVLCSLLRVLFSVSKVDSLLSVESGRKMLDSFRRTECFRMLQLRLGWWEAARSMTSGAKVVFLLSLPFLGEFSSSDCPSLVSRRCRGENETAGDRIVLRCCNGEALSDMADRRSVSWLTGLGLTGLGLTGLGLSNIVAICVVAHLPKFALMENAQIWHVYKGPSRCGEANSAGASSDNRLQASLCPLSQHYR